MLHLITLLQELARDPSGKKNYSWQREGRGLVLRSRNVSLLVVDGLCVVMGTIMIEHTIGGMLDQLLIKWVDSNRVIDHGYCSSMVEYNRSSAMLEHDPFCVLQE